MHVDSQVDATITPAGPFCETDAAVNLNAATSGGTWSGTGVVGNTFDPAVAGPGDHLIQYNVINGACSDSDTETLHVDSILEATIIEPSTPICESYGIITLQSINTGGFWSGNGISGNTFDPSIAGQGDHQITYTITQGVCTSQDHVIIHVDTIPNIILTSIGPFCEDTEFAYLQAIPNNGTWSGTGVTNPATGQFSPLFSGPGDHTVIYTVANGMCTAQDSFIVHVDEYLDATITPINNLCQNGPQITLHAATPGGVWAGQGIIDPINGILDPSLTEHGNNTITYTITNGICVSTDLHIYQVDAFISANIITIPTTVCNDAEPFQLESENPGGIWSGQGIANPSTGVFNPQMAGEGNHIIIYTINNGSCNDSDQIQINVIAVPNTTITPAGPFCETDAATNLSSATPGGIWSGNGIIDINNGIFDPSVAGQGIHTITYSFNLGQCLSSSNTNIEVYNNVDATITPIAPICDNSEPIVLQAVSPGGTWAGTGVIGNTFYPNIAGAGNHTIIYTVNNGTCSDSDSITIIVDGNINITINPVSPICENSAPISLNASTAGGIWSGNGIIDQNLGIFDPSMSGAGNQTISYILNNGACTSISTIDILVYPIPNAIISGLNNSYCEYEDITVVVISPPGGILSGPGIQGFTFNPSLAGPGNHTITYTVTNAYNCTSIAQTTLTVFPSIAPNIIIPTDQFCYNGDVVTLAAIPSGGIFSGPGVSGYKFTPQEAGSGNHTINYVYTDANGCENLASVDVTVSTPILIEITGQNLTCYGNPTGSLQANVSGGVPDYSYVWDDPASSTESSINNLLEGTYNLTVTDSWFCIETSNYTLTSPSQLNVNISTYSNPTCFGYNNGSATVSANGGTPPYSYIWDDENSSQSFYINNLAQGTYTVSVEDYYGCSGSASISLIEPEELSIEIINVQDNVCSGGNTGSATAHASGGTLPYTYLWNNDAHTPLATANHLFAGTYTVTVTDANECTASENLTINEPEDIVVEISKTDVECASHLGSANINVNGGTEPYTYIWTNGETNPSITNLMQGIYTVTVKDANNCIKTSSIAIDISGSINASISEIQGITCYNSPDAILNAISDNGMPPINYYWSNGIHNQINENLFPGTYTVTAMDSWGCSGSAEHTVNNVPSITVIPYITATGCTGDATGSISITISGGQSPYSTIWSNGETGTSIYNLNYGIYYVTVTDANNCNIVADFTVEEPENPLKVDLLKTDARCKGANNGSITLNVSGGTPQYTYNWEFDNNTFNGSSASNLSPGIYNITVNDALGCEWKSSIEIFEPSQIDYSYISMNPSCIGNNDGYIEISITGGTPPYLIFWSDQTAPTEYITGLREGKYSFTIIDANGCKQSMQEITLKDEDVECIIIPNAFTPNGDGINDTWIIENIELYPLSLIQVFNRWGQIVFEGKGGGTPWNGIWNNNPVPTGSYVYTIDLFNGTKYCGIVTVIK